MFLHADSKDSNETGRTDYFVDFYHAAAHIEVLIIL